MTGLHGDIGGRTTVLQALTVRGEDGGLVAAVVLDAREVRVDDFHELFPRAALRGRYGLGVFGPGSVAQEILLGRLRPGGGDAESLGGHDRLDLSDLMVIDPEPGTDDHRIAVLKHPCVEADRAPLRIRDIQSVRPHPGRVLPEAIRDRQGDAVLRIARALGERRLARIVRQQCRNELLGHSLQTRPVAISAADIGRQGRPRLCRCRRCCVRRQASHEQSAGSRGQCGLRGDTHCRESPKFDTTCEGHYRLPPGVASGNRLPAPKTGQAGVPIGIHRPHPPPVATI